MVLKGVYEYENGGFVRRDISIPCRTVSFSPSDDIFSIPGLVDVHVHFREPGFSYKETVRTGSAAAARSGYTAVCTMPNLNPVPDSLENLAVQEEIIARDAAIRVLPYASITVGERGEELVDMEALAPRVIAFSDDGRGVQSESMMREAMLRAKALGKMIVAHCEDNSLLRGVYIHDGEYARAHGHKGICSESEWGPIARDLRLAKETGCAYHVCHISCKESVDLIRRAKREGVDVTCETAPHYLLLSDRDMQEDARFKMNPPLRSEADMEALMEGFLDGTIDMIATDHAPHTAEEKARGLAAAPMGVSGIEIAFPILYTYLVRPGIIPLSVLVERMSLAPRRRFGIEGEGDRAIFNLSQLTTVNPDSFLSMGKSTPFLGWDIYGNCILTQVGGKTVWQDSTIVN